MKYNPLEYIYIIRINPDKVKYNGGNMDFSKREINTSVLKASKRVELAADDDFNIPDMKDDIDKIIAKNGYIVVEEVGCEEGKVRVAGTMYFTVLYKTTGKNTDIEALDGYIPFEQSVNIEGVTRNNQAECISKLEDLTVAIINSRKVEVRCLIENGISVYQDVKINVATDLENGQGIECQFKKETITNTVVSKHDVFKIREEVEIPQSKPNIKEILWSFVELKNMDVRPMEDKLSVRGEVEIFVIYKGQEEHLPIQYLFSARAISKEIDCQGSEEGMLLEAICTLGKGEVSIKGDKDNEERIIGIDYSVDMNLKLYQDQEVNLINDLYSPSVEIIPKKEIFGCHNLLMRNVAKAKINYRKTVGDENTKILQVCHVYGNVWIDDVEIHQDSVSVEGVVKASVLYISVGDEPMSCMEIDVPFSYTADTVPLSKDDSVRIYPSIDQLNASLANSQEIEIKGVVSLGMSIFAKNNMEAITDMQLEPIDTAKKAAMPGIVGYVVKKGDTLWSIARKYYATTESIRSINGLESDFLNEGDKIIVVKS